MAKELALLLVEQAQSDLNEIYDPLFTEILHRMALLRLFPRLGRRLTGQFSGWRGTVVGLFRIIYRVSPRGIEVGYIRHCKRRMPVK